MERWFKKKTFRYRLLHVVMWLLLSAWSFIAYYGSDYTVHGQVIHALILSCMTAIPFYLSAYVLVPRFLYQRRFFAFILLVGLLVVVMGLLTLLVMRISFHIRNPSVSVIPPPDQIGPLLSLFLWNTVLAVAASTAAKFLSDRFRLEKQLHVVEQEKVRSELDFLRSQVNPHFLFNTMNTIYFQIDKGNVVARESVVRFSEILRYQLYECTTDKIDIEKELAYIRNYTDMQSLRMEEGTDVIFSAKGLHGFKIAPLLLIPFIENAFKHVSHYEDPAMNKIHITLEDNGAGIFSAHIVNTCGASRMAYVVEEAGGLGIRNVVRRLELLYPGRHELHVKEGENQFETLLKINHA